jgi:hypothetical protein
VGKQRAGAKGQTHTDFVGDGGAELHGRSPKVLRSRVQMDSSSHFGLNNGWTKVGRIGIEFSVGVGEQRDGSDIDATLHRDNSPTANPEGYTLSFSAEGARGAHSSGGVEDVLIVKGAHSAGVGVVGEGGERHIMPPHQRPPTIAVHGCPQPPATSCRASICTGSNQPGMVSTAPSTGFPRNASADCKNEQGKSVVTSAGVSICSAGMGSEHSVAN